jgi:hypothetical protein
MKRYTIISCGGLKQAGTHPAEELYTSSNFRMTLAAAETIADEVLILSAKHGLLRRSQVVDWYDLRIGDPGMISVRDLTRQVEQLDTPRSITTLLPKAYAQLMDRAAMLAGRDILAGCHVHLFEGTRGIGDQRAICKGLIDNQEPAQ